MKCATVFTALALASTTVASWAPWPKNCLSDAEAQYLIDQEIIFLKHTDIEAARAVAYSIFADDIQEYGDSINSLRYEPLGSIVENGLATYVNDSLSQPGTPVINTLYLMHDCSAIFWQWSFEGVGIPPLVNSRINGFTLAKVNADKKINYQYVEFNSLAWAENFGFTVTPPTYGPFAPGGEKKMIRREFSA